jgi:ABC-type polysaccharide/polyol phosphate transport system ATPase subunit
MRRMSAVIELRDVGKLYTKLEQERTLVRSLLPIRAEKREALWALRHVGLEVGQGETIAILGHNGAGKTTLLRLLAGVTRPTTGRVRVEGRIGPLIGLGVGFHEEMSGRENVLVNGMLLGLEAEQVRSRFDQIVEFAELEKFIDTPVKFYSSGMFMRLGFAVMAHTDPTILLVDEVLAVGDASFQQKCFARLHALREQGATIVMVSHSTHMVRQLCERAVVMRRGRIEYDGGIEDGIALLERSAGSGADHTAADAPVTIVACGFEDGKAAWRRAEPDELVELNLRIRFHRRVEDPVITVGAITDMGLFGGFDSTPPGAAWRTFDPGEEADVRITFPVRLGVGTYRLVVEVKKRDGDQRLARSDDLLLKVAGSGASSGLVDVRAQIRVGDHRLAPLGSQT